MCQNSLGMFLRPITMSVYWIVKFRKKISKPAVDASSSWFKKTYVVTLQFQLKQTDKKEPTSK
jgi:hypothetical protein